MTLNFAAGSSGGQLWVERMEGNGEGGSVHLQCGWTSSPKAGSDAKDVSDRCSTEAHALKCSTVCEALIQNSGCVQDCSDQSSRGAATLECSAAHQTLGHSTCGALIQNSGCGQDCSNCSTAAPLELERSAVRTHVGQSGLTRSEPQDSSESKQLDSDRRRAVLGDVMSAVNCAGRERRGGAGGVPLMSAAVSETSPPLHCCADKDCEQLSSSGVTVAGQHISMETASNCIPNPNLHIACSHRTTEKVCDQSTSHCVIDCRTSSDSHLHPSLYSDSDSSCTEAEEENTDQHSNPSQSGVRKCISQTDAGRANPSPNLNPNFDPDPKCLDDGEDVDKHSNSSLTDAETSGRQISLRTRPSPNLNSNIDPHSKCWDDEDSCTVEVGSQEDSQRLGQEAGSRGDCCEQHHHERRREGGCASAMSSRLKSAACEGEGRTDSGSDTQDTGPLFAASKDKEKGTPGSAWGAAKSLSSCDQQRKAMCSSGQLGTKAMRSVFGSGAYVRIKQESPDELPASPSRHPHSPSQPLKEHGHAGRSLVPLSCRVKQEPVDDCLEMLHHEGRKAHSRPSNTLSGHRGLHAAFTEQGHHMSTHRSHMHNVYVSFASSASKKIKREFPDHIDSLNAFQENGETLYSSSAVDAATLLDCHDKTSDCSDESDCETLPVHFETPGRGVRNDSSSVSLSMQFEAPQRGLGEELFYECGMCQIGFSLPAQCHEHVIQHDASDRCYVCGSCKVSFLQMALLTQHVPVHTFAEGRELNYDNPKAFVCHVCAKIFRRLYELNRHQSIHSGNKPFSCDACHKMFARVDELNRHVRVHSGIRPFACEDCSRAFITRHELNQHTKSHAEHRPFVCPVCSRGFLRADKLFHHQQMHAGDRPHTCEVCHKAFITQSELRQHQKIHTGLKPFECQLCCKAYLKVNDLNRHMKMHTGQKPFTCDVCGKAFHRTDILSRHKKIHTRTKIVRRGRPPKSVALHNLAESSVS